MYSLENIKTMHLEITNKCQASCPMCARNLQGGLENPFIELDEITIDIFKDWFSVDFIKQLNRIYMCGNLGDPIIAKDTVEIFRHCRTINPDINLSMNTNGSARNKDFWMELAELGVKIHFGIDGLGDTHSIYRRGTNFDTIIQNASVFINNGGYAIWDMLIFDHNKHQVDDCKGMADQLGFKVFQKKHTSRFKEESITVIDKIGKPVYKIYSSERSKNFTTMMIHQNLENSKINCKVKEEKSLYVSATGNVAPCCWLDMEWVFPVSTNRIDYLEKIGEFKTLKDYTLKEIFDSGFFYKIEKTWEHNPLKECSKQCGNFKKFESQFEK